jgi:hypothetical protein
MDWVNCYNQSIVFLRLDFAATYDEVIWKFVFLAFLKLGMESKFTNMMRLLFQNAKAIMCFNDAIIKSFRIERWIKATNFLPFLS